ncbi:MAG: prenyltransferase/squalene oxidase repeat-containing protein [Mariniblastus sp.]
MDSIEMIEEKVGCRSHELRFGIKTPVNRNRGLACAVTPCFFLIVVLANAFLVTPSASAQAVYNPEHPEVRALADDLVNYLKGAVKPNSQINSRVLAALAVVQHSKRYNGSVPLSDPLVKQACEDVAAQVDEIIENEREMYLPCITIILLAETNARAYREPIKKLLRFLEDRQNPNGSYTYRNEGYKSCDMSQTQFAALAMFVAKLHGFDMDVQMAKRTLDWTLNSQAPDGGWAYKLKASGQPNDPGFKPRGATSAEAYEATPSISMTFAGGGTAYLLSDFLQLNKRAKSMSKSLSKKTIGLPKTVTIYVEPVDGKSSLLNKTGPLVQFDRGKFSNKVRTGNAWLERGFKVDRNIPFTCYYLFTLERYAYFREQGEGNVGNANLVNWYDEGFKYLLEQRGGNSVIKPQSKENNIWSPALAILFLVRSSEVLNVEPAESRALGGQGFRQDAVLRTGANGLIRQVETEKNLSDLISMMKEGEADNEQLRELAEALKKQISEFRAKDDKSRGEIKAFLQSMIAARNYYRRLIAVRFLAGEQAMDNVPALLYALGDPDLRICIEAHDGLRLVSRKIDSMKLSDLTRKNGLRDPDALTGEEDDSCRLEIGEMKRKWTEWFLKIRPSAELLD